MPSAFDQKRAAPCRSSVRQSMMNPASRLLCMAYLTSARRDWQFHVDVAARVFRVVGVDRATKSEALVKAQRVVELGVGLEEDRASSLLRGPLHAGCAEHLAD